MNTFIITYFRLHQRGSQGSPHQVSVKASPVTAEVEAQRSDAIQCRCFRNVMHTGLKNRYFLLCTIGYYGDMSPPSLRPLDLCTALTRVSLNRKTGRV